MRILVADSLPDTARRELTEHGHECHYEPDITAGELPDRLATPDAPDVLVVRSTPVNSAALDAATKLRFVIRAGSGTNTIDCATAHKHGVPVATGPGRNPTAAAELALALLLALDRAIPDNVVALRNGHWNKKQYAHATGIAGRDVGVIGLGSIGLAFAERAHALGATIHAVAKPDRPPEVAQRAAAIGVDFVDHLAELARRCDVLSLHVPANEATRGLLDRSLLELLTPGAIILNTARAELIDEQALTDMMDSKGIRAGVDVFADEPGTSTGSIHSALAQHPNTYGTHHIGASTQQAQHAIAAEVVRMVNAFQEGTTPHLVNSPEAAVATDRPNVLLSSTSPGGGA